MSALAPCLRPLSPSLAALIDRARNHRMTKAEVDAQRRSWVRGELMLEHPEMTRDEVDALIDRAERRS